MAGKVHDRQQLNVDRDPTRQLALEVGKFKGIDPVVALKQATKFVEEYLLDAFHDVTGIDLSSISKLFGAFPGIDASKIISGVFAGGLIPGLDASKIVSGIFGGGLIPGLDVSKITSGVFGGGFIPGLDASKIISGSFSMDRVTGLAAAIAAGDASGVIRVLTGIDAGTLNDLGDWVKLVPKLAGGLLSGGIIPGLDASKITSGIFGAGAIPSLDASKIGSGIFGAGLIPGLDVAKIVSGVFGAGRIPALDASKITTGSFAQSQVTGLPAAIAAALTSGSPLDAGKLVGNVASSLLSGTLAGSLIPSLDASKIGSGTFADGLVPGLGAARDAIVQAITGGTATGATSAQVKSALAAIPGGNIASAILASIVPTLDASKIATGTLATAQIPNLNASKITAGTLLGSLIPALDAGKITTGQFPQSMVNLTSIASGLLSGTIGAGLIPALDASKITSGTFPQSMLSITNIAASIVSGVLDVARIPSLDAGKITSGSFGATLIPLLDATKIATGTFGDAFVPGLGNLVSGLFGALTGNVGDNVTQAQTSAQVAELAATTAANSAAIAALQSTEDGNANSGLNGGDEFTRTTSNGIGPGWETLYYDGSDANGYWRIDGQQCVWIDGGNAPRMSRHIRTDPVDMTTLTDYQKTTLVQGTSTAEEGATLRILHRVNAARTQYVICQIGTGSALFGYTNNGPAGETQFPTDSGPSSVGTSTAVGVAWTLESGLSGGIRLFRLSRNSMPILTYTDANALSAVGPNNRGWGWGGGSVQRNFGQATPSTVTRITIADNTPAPVVGSGLRVYRASTAAIGKAASETVQPANFFDTIDVQTPDIKWDGATQTATVRDAGWYSVQIAIRTAGGTNNAANQCAVLYVGTAAAPAGVVKQRGTPQQSGGSGGVAQGYYGQFSQYVPAGGTLRPGSTGSGSMPNQTGSADGANTFMTITKTNPG